MPVTFMAWNVQNFGQNSANQQLLKGVNNANLAQIIARVVVANNVDVLGMMEVCRNSQASLQNVVNALNAASGQFDWCCDYIPGSVAAGTAPGEDNIMGPANLDWEGDAMSPRREGYAFFWRAGNPNFRVLPARTPYGGAAPSLGVLRGALFPAALGVPAKVANLSYMQRRTTYHAASPFVRARDGFEPDRTVFTNWEPSYYPGTSVYNVNHVFYQQVRRPAYIVIQLRNAGVDVGDPVSLMCYHAPSNSMPARVGTTVSGFAQELYAYHQIFVLPARAVFAGDYNVPVDAANAWTQTYRPITAPFGATNAAGANCAAFSSAAHPLNTTIQLRELQGGIFNGPPLAGPHFDTYCLSPIDNLFYRGLTTATLPTRVNVPVLVMNGGALAGISIVAQTMSILQSAIIALLAGRNVDPNRGPTNADGTYVYPFLTDWQDFLAGAMAGEFPTMRSACEFTREFISDHLPVFYSFQVA